ncbi:MAG: CAP domain-containing protein, partial [Anaerolineales bacterium]
MIALRHSIASVWGVAMLAFWLMAPPPASAQADQDWLLQNINALRANLGLHQYAPNSALYAAAQAHADWMAATGTISHTGANDSSPGARAAAFGYGGSMVSENIYGGVNAAP